MWVPPFRYLRITVYLPLPAAFRSLSRLSSALSAKASALRSFSLTNNLGSGLFRSADWGSLLPHVWGMKKDRLRSKGYEEGSAFE